MGWQDGHGGAFGGGSWNGPAHSSGGLGGMGGGGGFGGGGGSGGNSGAPRGTGLTTGGTWYGNSAFGPAGGMAQGYATRGPGGQYGNFRGLGGQPLAGGFTNERGFPGVQPPRSVSGQRMPFPGGYVPPVLSASIPPPAAVPPVARPPVARPFVGIPRPVMPPQVNFNPSLPQYSAMQSAVQVPHRSLANMGASNYSYYNNPTLGTPGFAGGLGDYAGGGGGWGSKGNFGG
jgi:hypothetical protein